MKKKIIGNTETLIELNANISFWLFHITWNDAVLRVQCTKVLCMESAKVYGKRKRNVCKAQKALKKLDSSVFNTFALLSINIFIGNAPLYIYISIFVTALLYSFITALV